MTQLSPADLNQEELDKIRIGRQIRDLRKSKGISQSYIAEKTGKSIGYISQVERGISALPIPVLQSISNILGVNITWFFHADGEQSHHETNHVVRKDARRHLNFSGEGIREELLSPWMNSEFIMIMTTFYPGAESDKQPRKRRGDEAGCIKSGTLELTISGECFTLHEGDSFHLAEDDTYHAYNPSTDEECVVFWVLSPSS